MNTLARSSTALASPGGSPSVPGTSISIVATFSFNGQNIVINTGDIASGNFVFSLNQPVVLGSFLDFIQWLNKEFDVPLTEADVMNAIDSIPTTPAILGDIRSALQALASGVVTITILNVNTQAGTFQFGITYVVPDSPAISFLGITFKQLGVMVQKVGATSP